MQTKRILTGILLLAAFGMTIFGQTQDPPDPSELERRIVERQYDDVNDTKRWETIVKYPEVRLEGDRPAESFNRDAKALVMAEVARFEKDMNETSPDDMPDGMSYYQSIGYSTEYFDDNVISVKFFQSEFTGGAHPNHWTHTLTYDLKNDKRLNLQDFFSPGSDFLSLISAAVNVSLKQQMGEFADDEWIANGTGVELKNYSSWNITPKGFLFTFDPYQVGPYAAGSFEVVVIHSNFNRNVRSPLFRLAEVASYIDGSPPTYCRGGRWTMLDTEYKLASVKGRKNTRAYFFDDNEEGNCPFGTDCKKKSYLIAGDEVIVQREYGDYSCVWYQPAKGAETVGWLRSDAIETRVDASKPPRNWIGDWSYASNGISIKESPSGKLHVYGTAIWQGMGDNVHVGEIDFLEMPNVGLLKAGEGDDKYDCRVRLRRLGKYLLVDDNLMCGGANVSFNGVYLKKQ